MCLPAIADKTRGFDRIKAGYHGPLYAEISRRPSRCWCAKARVSQIRFRHGNALLDGEALRTLHARAAGRRRRGRRERGRCGRRRSLGLGPDRLVGYRAKRHRSHRRRAALGLRRRRFWSRSRRAPMQLISIPTSCSRLKEAVQVPPTTPPRWCRSIRWWASFACTTRDSSIRASAMRVPAGAAHAVLEVRSREVPFILSMARSSAAWSMRRCWRGRTRSTAPASAPTIRHRA